MNSLLNREDDEDLDQLAGPKDREITLGTSLILGIFLGLALLCAVFFGFGYSIGHKSASNPVPPSPGTQTTSITGGSKPSPGSPLGGQTTGPTVTVPLPARPLPPAARTPQPENADQSAEEAGTDSANAPRSAAAAAPATAPVPVVTPGGSSIVQIAAVSHQEDADLLITTLKRRGYSVAVHSEPQDKLLHVQVGPFATHKDADAMRQRLLADGFNAIVKDTH